jgi:hypothetical protein
MAKFNASATNKHERNRMSFLLAIIPPYALNSAKKGTGALFFDNEL